jgi:starch synthase (maltosyl-transferring)
MGSLPYRKLVSRRAQHIDVDAAPHPVPEPDPAPVDRRRVIIEGIEPCVDGGRFPIKRSIGERVEVSADIFADGHDVLAAALRYRGPGDEAWQEVPMVLEGNDRWTATFAVERLGSYEYAVRGWVGAFASWRAALIKKVAAEQDVSSELLAGAALVRAAASRATRTDAAELKKQAELLAQPGNPQRIAAALAPALAAAMARYADREQATDSAPILRVCVEVERAAWGAWYEMFPRSASPIPDRHGTLADVEARLPYVAAMGFDVLYLPPIHPIGATQRKGRNNTPGAQPDEPGSPWAIGSHEGGHTAVHPALGNVEDVRRLVHAARRYGIDIALDVAFQCSPDHPYVREHPEWFHRRPDGTVQYAENPPKKYQDIYPLDFEGPDARGLWDELERVVVFWIDCGIHIFRVDNPHTKPFHFWEWLIASVRRRHPDVVFLSEAFTRPKVMRYLAKLGFSQSYTYFTWRTTKTELIEYFTELTQTEAREYLRPNLFTNTPDILHAVLQTGGRPAVAIRFVLAATLGANYGIYGPAFELCEDRALPSSEEYLDSEKYQLRHWDLERPDSLRPLITAVNAARHANPALRTQRTLRFIPTDNDQLLCYSKHSADGANLIIVVVNLDPHRPQSGWVDVPLWNYFIGDDQPYRLHDLLTGAGYVWRGGRNFVRLDPAQQPAHIFRVTL